MKLSDLVEFLDDPSEFEIHYKGSKVEYLNEAGTISDSSRFFVAGFEFGAHVLVHVESYRGDGFEAAWSAWIDESETIPESELIEALCESRDKGSFEDEAIDAYPGRGEGRWTDEDWAKIRANAKAALESCESPELVEGYEYQSNFKGTGIVSLGHYAWMNEADLDDIEIVRKGQKAVCVCGGSGCYRCFGEEKNPSE